METADPIKVALRFVSILEEQELRYLVSGSLASSLYGIPRATQDVDIVVEINERHVARLFPLLEPTFYVDKEALLDAVRDNTSFNIIDKEEMLKIDVFVQKPNDAAQEEMGRRVLHPLAESDGASMYLCSAEDIVVQKLLWFKLGGGVSERQWVDVLGVLRVQKGSLDYSYMLRMARQRNVLELLEKARAESANSND